MNSSDSKLIIEQARRLGWRELMELYELHIDSDHILNEIVVQNSLWKPIFELCFPDKEKQEAQSYKQVFDVNYKGLLSNPNIYRNASNALKDDEKLLLELISTPTFHKIRVYEFSSERLRNNIQIAVSIFDEKGVFGYEYIIPEQLKSNKQFAYKMLKGDRTLLNLNYISDDLKEDWDFISNVILKICSNLHDLKLDIFIPSFLDNAQKFFNICLNDQYICPSKTGKVEVLLEHYIKNLSKEINITGIRSLPITFNNWAILYSFSEQEEH